MYYLIHSFQFQRDFKPTRLVSQNNQKIQITQADLGSLLNYKRLYLGQCSFSELDVKHVQKMHSFSRSSPNSRKQLEEICFTQWIPSNSRFKLYDILTMTNFSLHYFSFKIANSEINQKINASPCESLDAQAWYVVEDTVPPWPVQLVWTNLPGALSSSYVWAPK